MNRAGLATLLSMLIVIPASTGWAEEKRYRTYTVESGDSCWSVALKLFGKGERYTIIHQYNNLGPLPHLLKPGQKLKLPHSGTGPDARLDWLHRTVKAKPPRAVDWRRARKNMGLWKLYKVSTAKSSSARILFEDRSRLMMREHALLVIYGTSASRGQMKQRIKTTVRVEEGVIRGGLERLDRGGDMTINTPSSAVKLRSRSAQVEVDARRDSIVSVYDGEADVSAKGSTVMVPEGHGTVVHRGKKPLPPRKLPSAPRWQDTGDVTVLVPSGALGQVEARWQPVKGAARYRVEFSLDAAFHYPIVDVVVGAGIHQLRASDLKVGRYHARVSVIDRARLEGAPSSTLKVSVQPVKSSRPLQLAPDGVYEAIGMVRLDLPSTSAIEVSIDSGPFSRRETVRLAVQGTYRIRTRSVGSQVVSELRVRLIGVQAILGVPARVVAESSPVLVELKVQDERSRPAALPGLALMATPGGAVDLHPLGAGRYQAALKLRGEEKVKLVASWVGGELDSAEIEVKAQSRQQPHRSPRAPRVTAPSRPVGGVPAEWGLPGPGLPSRSARPETHLAMTGFVSGVQRKDNDPIFLRLALQGGLALFDGRLGLDAELPWFNPDLTYDQAGGSEVGDLRLGARWVALTRGAWTFTPSLRVTLPTGGFERDHRTAILDPAFIVEWQRGDWLLLSGNGFFAIHTGSPGAGFYPGATLGGAVRLWRGLMLAAELDLVFRLSDLERRSSATGLATAGILAWRFSHLRLGLAAGAGLDQDAREIYGPFTVGLLVDLIFGDR